MSFEYSARMETQFSEFFIGEIDERLFICLIDFVELMLLRRRFESLIMLRLFFRVTLDSIITLLIIRHADLLKNY